MKIRSNTCLIIAKRGSGTDEDKRKFVELQKGIRAFGNSFLMSGNFRLDEALPASARIAHLAAKILVNDLSPIARYEGYNIQDWNVDSKEWNFLNRLKRLPDKSTFYYWYLTNRLLEKHLK